MKKVFKSRILVISLVGSLLFAGLSFLGAGAPTSAGSEAMLSVMADSEPATSLSQDGHFIPADLLRIETESMQKYVEALTNYNDQLESLSNSRNPDQRQVAMAETELRSLRGQAPQFQNAARLVIAKLKRAGKWTAELDSYFETAAARKGLSSEIIEDVKRGRGFRNFFEKLIPIQSKISEQFDEAEKKINEMKLKKVGLLDRLGDFLMPSAHANFVFLGCGYCAQLASIIMLLVIPATAISAAMLKDFHQGCRGWAIRCLIT